MHSECVDALKKNKINVYKQFYFIYYSSTKLLETVLKLTTMSHFKSFFKLLPRVWQTTHPHTPASVTPRFPSLFDHWRSYWRSIDVTSQEPIWKLFLSRLIQDKYESESFKKLPVGSPVWTMKPLMTRWKMCPL